jgi:hypothetical protein
MNRSTESIFAEYLADVDAAARDLPSFARREMVTSLTNHIAEVTAERNVTTADEARRLIAEIGEPEVLVAEARAAEGDATAEDEKADVRSVLGWMTVGTLVPFFGWYQAALRLWRSRAWATRDKVLGTILFPGGPWAALVVAVVVLSNSGEICSYSETGQTDGPGGSPVGTPLTSRACQSTGALPVWLARSLAVVILLSSLAGPAWLAYRSRRTQR